jgi:hypothetical protein
VCYKTRPVINDSGLSDNESIFSTYYAGREEEISAERELQNVIFLLVTMNIKMKIHFGPWHKF